MRRELRQDLDTLRATARDVVDAKFDAIGRHKFDRHRAVYEAKRRAAEIEPRTSKLIAGSDIETVWHPLAQEAQDRGLSISAMRDLVRRRAAEADDAIHAHDRERRQAHREIAEATSAPALLGIIDRHR